MDEKINSPKNKTSGTYSNIRDIFEYAIECIARIDRQGNYLSVNEHYAETLGYHRDEINGLSWFDTIHKDDIEKAKSAYEAMLEHGRADIEVRGIRKNGTTFYEHILLVKGINEESSVLGHYCFMQDITEQKLTEYVSNEKDLDKSRFFIETVIRLSPDIICVTDFNEGKIIDINEGFCKATGWTREEAIGKTTTELNIYPLDIRKKYVDMIINDGEINGEELIFYKKNGDTAYVLASSFIIDLFGENRILTIARDITERKQSEILLELESKCYQIDSNTRDLNQTLLSIIQEIESHFDTLIGSISLLDTEKKHLVNTVAPGLPQKYLDKIDGVEIGEGIGSCGTAVSREELVIVSDIENDELWRNYRDLAGSFGLKACWSIPVKSSRHQVLGTFAGYYQQIQSPSSFELMLLNHVARIVGNIIEQKQNDEKLRESREKFKTLYDGTPSMFFSLNEEGIIVSVNHFGARFLGYEIKDLIGKSVLSIIHEYDKHKASEKLKECFSNPGTMYRWEIRKRHRDGHIIWVRETAHVISTNNSQEIFIVCEDISENYRLSQQLEYQATHDALTSLVNRREFENRLERVLNEKAIHIPGHAICYLDLDNFKVINDTCGHLAGDAMLKQLSELLSTSVRNRDTLARLGGDEFGILMEHCSLNKATKVAEKILSVVEEYRFVWNDNKFAIGVSIGLVPIDETSGNVNDVLSAADNACYVAKDAGRNRIHVFSPDDAELERRRGEMQWVARINEALEEDMFCLFYQEVISARSGKQSAKKRFELLVRIKTHDDNYIMPGAFLPAAERYNLSTKIDQWVIGSALDWLSSDMNISKTVGSCAINVSGHSLSNENFLDFCIDKITKSKVPANKLCFEITETAAIANLGSARIFMSELKEKGCSFALDDFGSGLSSFAYLKNLPVDYIKIDGAFIRDLLIDPVDFEMVTAINRLGHVMDKMTIAEFVENDEILHMLNDIGVDYAQGYGVSKPKPIELFLSKSELKNR